MDEQQKKNNNRVPFDEDNYTHNIHKQNERSLDRRSFMKLMVGAAGVFAVSTLPWGTIAARELTGLRSKQYEAAKVADISAVKVGDAIEFAYPGEHDSALLIRLGENEYKAYQNACTHLKCPVYWSKEQGEMLCPCHHGVFDVKTGAPTAGPPRRPLPEIVLKQEQGAIFATGVKRYDT
ncbi:Arsenite oxidase subunit AioB [Paenibacillus solanacearum]|uniref:Arsenite oxidase subunit AioB n=1 Tax=Paenibacillus solanacearum TaxID=2048548 RepID=A0A916NRF4_9BACL|nr:Rieske (2Fe-2S) protein [Paenibacillus solanacearum]CAG7641651.1 Arsenite oxidase subunit AioB [Paenibacillus solanacearum]